MAVGGRGGPPRRRSELSVAIPASLVSDVPHLREKTHRVGLVGRAAAIFRVDEVIVFPDLPSGDQRRDAGLVATLLSYMETPQYLRRRLFKVRPELRYVGILPPLRTPHHPLSSRVEDLSVGEHREGVVVSSAEEGSLVDVGVERPAMVSGTRLPVNRRVTVRITGLGERLQAVPAGRGEVREYWGYRVTVSNVPLGSLLRRRSFDMVVATSRRGTPLADIVEELRRRWGASRTVLVAFGAPDQGLHGILAREGLRLEEVAHLIVNTVPRQGAETVRTEEALYASLAALNLLIGD